MTIYIALLRGINVSGHNLIKMTELKRMFEAMGFARVQTFIQSGNVLFATDDDAGSLCARIEQEITTGFGMTVPVVLRTAAELERIIRDCPFPADALAEGENIYVTLLADQPAPERITQMLSVPGGIDEFRIIGRELYILYRQPAHLSKLTNNLTERKLGTAATTRNWQTINKLAVLTRAMEA
jgi:uncharacterized protein (DUF1697 family)